MSIFKHKGHTSIVSTVLNILGLTAAMAAFYIIMVQVHHDFSYNKKIMDSERVFVAAVPDWYAEGRWMTFLNRPLPEGFIRENSKVECGGTCYVGPAGAEGVAIFKPDGDNDRFLCKSTMSQFSRGAAEAFGIELTKGSWDDFTANGNWAVSESVARKACLDVGSPFLYQGDSRLNLSNDKNTGTVVCIFKDLPDNSDLSGIGMFCDMGNQSMEEWSEWSYPYFFKLHSAADREAVEKEAYEYVRKILVEEYGGEASPDEIDESVQRYRMRLVPIADSYFDSMLRSPGRQGSKTTTVTLLCIAILVLLIAFINYYNFFFALIPVRMKSVNMRKILGSSRGTLIASFVLESVVLVAVSLVLAAVVVYLFQGSIYAKLISADTTFGSNVGMIALTAVLGILLAVLSSLYPAAYITSFQPALAIKGSFAASVKGRKMRNVLVGLQFVISLSLIICVIFVNMQRKWMLNHDLGFDRENLLTCQTSRTVAASRNSVSDELKKDPQIVDVTWANGNIVSGSKMGWGREFNGRQINYKVYPVDWNFLRVMGIHVTEGRDFRQSDEMSTDGVYIFNETARKEFDLHLDDNMGGHTDDYAEIAGFCEDFNFTGMQNKIQPFCFYIFGTDSWKVNSTLYVRTAKGADMASVMSRIRKTVAQADPNMVESEVDVRLFDSTLQSMYVKESNLSKMLSLLTILAIIISLMGIFGIVMFETEFRRKEIGVRRVNGANVAEILEMFNIKFIGIVLICFLIAAPFSYVIVDRYLSNFAYRMPIYLWVFAASLAAVLAVTSAVVTLRSLRAATQNPVDALKSE